MSSGLPTLGWVFHLLSLFMLIGVVWTVQLLVYPQFLRVGKVDWLTYHVGHCRQITIVVAPLMLLELITGVIILYNALEKDLYKSWVPYLVVNLVLIGSIWISTTLIQVPLHRQLEMVADNSQRIALIRALIVTNWIRTVAWTLRGIGWTVWLVRGLQSHWCR